MENLLNFHKEPFSALENHPNTSAYTKPDQKKIFTDLHGTTQR